MGRMMIKSAEATIEINVVHYFGVNKNHYMIYEKEAIEGIKRVYLSKVIRNNKELKLEKIDGDKIAEVQSVVKQLVSDVPDGLKKLKYIKHDINKVIKENIVENGFQTIDLSEDQYNNLTKTKKAKKKSSAWIFIILLLLLAGGGA